MNEEEWLLLCCCLVLGKESAEIKHAMRLSSLACDGVFVMAAWYLCLRLLYYGGGARSASVSVGVQWSQISSAYLVLLLCPLFIVIDHGHFQYNSVPLGLVLYAYACFAYRQQPTTSKRRQPPECVFIFFLKRFFFFLF